MKVGLGTLLVTLLEEVSLKVGFKFSLMLDPGPVTLPVACGLGFGTLISFPRTLPKKCPRDPP